MLLEVQNVRPSVSHARFNLASSGVKLVSKPLDRINVGFRRIARVLAHSAKLNNRFVRVSDNHRRVVEGKHFFFLRPKFITQRPRTIRSRTTSIKKNVPLTFTPVTVPARGVNALLNLFTRERLYIAGTEITATASAIESQKKESTHAGIKNVSSRTRCKLSYTEICTAYRGGS